MKRSVRRLISLLAVLLLLPMFAGCSMQLSFEDSDSDFAADAEELQTDVQNKSTRRAAVSIIQYSEYTALNECCEGIKSALDAEGISYSVTVGAKNSELSDCEQAARDIVINSSCDLVIAIGTPCAEAVCPIISSASKTPVVFCNVTDPKGASIVNDLKEPGLNCTGVAASFNVGEQLNMINTFQPYITKLGVIYTQSEQNTKKQLEDLKKAAEKLGIKVLAEPVEDSSQLSQTAKELMKKVEAVVLLQDNMLAQNSWNVTNQSIVGEIPLYGTTLQQIEEGCLAGYCYDFRSMGEKAGQQAVQVLHGESAADMPVVQERECTLYVNKDRLKDLDMEIPEEYKEAASQVSTSYEN